MPMLTRGLTETTGCYREAGAIILKVTYGYTVDPHQQDPLVEIADRALEQFSAAAAAGTWLVDSIPACPSYPLSTPCCSSNRSPTDLS